MKSSYEPAGIGLASPPRYERPEKACRPLRIKGFCGELVRLRRRESLAC